MPRRFYPPTGIVLPKGVQMYVWRSVSGFMVLSDTGKGYPKRTPSGRLSATSTTKEIFRAVKKLLGLVMGTYPKWDKTYKEEYAADLRRFLGGEADEDPPEATDYVAKEVLKEDEHPTDEEEDEAHYGSDTDADEDEQGLDTDCEDFDTPGGQSSEADETL